MYLPRATQRVVARLQPRKGVATPVRAGTATDEMARGVHHGHAALTEAGDDLVVGPNARAGLQVVGIEGNPAEVGNDGLQTRRRIAADPYGLDGFRAAAVERFQIVTESPIADSLRVLFLLRRR